MTAASGDTHAASEGPRETIARATALAADDDCFEECGDPEMWAAGKEDRDYWLRLTDAGLVARNASPDAECIKALWNLGSGWVGFERSHEYGDAILSTIGEHAASPPPDSLRALWRVGEHYSIHVYEGDRPVATFHTAVDARRAVAAVNGADSLHARLEVLRGLSEAATPGPWRYDIEFTKSDADPMVPDYWCVDINQGDARDEATVAYYSTLEDPTDDAAFITALVNLARELLAGDAAVNHVRAGMEET